MALNRHPVDPVILSAPKMVLGDSSRALSLCGLLLKAHLEGSKARRTQRISKKAFWVCARAWKACFVFLAGLGFLAICALAAGGSWHAGMTELMMLGIETVAAAVKRAGWNRADARHNVRRQRRRMHARLREGRVRIHRGTFAVMLQT